VPRRNFVCDARSAAHSGHEMLTLQLGADEHSILRSGKLPPSQSQGLIG
jgi:hypothetical protein